MASFGRAVRLARVWMQQAGSEGQVAQAAVQQCGRQTRSFASGESFTGAHHDSVTHAGLTLHKPARWHSVTGKAFSSLMWFWVFYRFYHDYDTFLFGHAQHHEHELHAAKHGAGGGEHSKEH